MLRNTLTVLALVALIALPASAEATLEEILATHVESKGGMKAIDGIQSMRIEGRITMGPGMEAPVRMEMIRPNQMRMEFEFQGMTGVQAFDGETGWQIMPFTGSTEPEKVTGTELEEFVDRADFDGPLINYEENGDTLEYLGTEEVEGTPAHKVKVTKKSGDETLYFLDTEHCLEIKSEISTTMQGMELNVQVSYSDYKEVEGVMMAHSITQTAAGTPMNQAITFDKIEANVEIAPDRFKMPEAKAAPEDATEKADGE